MLEQVCGVVACVGRVGMARHGEGHVACVWVCAQVPGRESVIGGYVGSAEWEANRQRSGMRQVVVPQVREMKVMRRLGRVTGRREGEMRTDMGKEVPRAVGRPNNAFRFAVLCLSPRRVCRVSR